MKQFFGSCLIFCFVFSLYTVKIASAEAGKTNFRKTTWGMSKSQVKATESEKPKFENDWRLGYLGVVLGMDTRIIYDFANNKLAEGQYLFSEKHTNKNDNIKDYERLKKALIKKYGKPVEDNIHWANELYKSDLEQWGFAVSLGHLVYLTKWEPKETEIGMMLMSDNYKIKIVIRYFSKDLRGLMKELKEKKQTDDL